MQAIIIAMYCQYLYHDQTFETQHLNLHTMNST